MEYVRNWCKYFIPTARNERAETAPLQTYKNNSTFIDKYKGSNQARLHWGFVKKKFQVSNKTYILHLTSNTSIYQLMVSPMQHFSARNINCRDSVTNRIVCNVLLQLTLQWNIASYCGHSWWVWQSVPPFLVERVEMSPLQIITWLLNTPDKDRSVGCFCWENLAAASYL